MIGAFVNDQALLKLKLFFERIFYSFMVVAKSSGVYGLMNWFIRISIIFYACR